MFEPQLILMSTIHETNESLPQVPQTEEREEEFPHIQSQYQHVNQPVSQTPVYQHYNAGPTSPIVTEVNHPDEQELVEKPTDQGMPKAPEAGNQPPIYSPRERVDKSNQIKNVGNEYFKKGEYIQSIQTYLQGLKVLDPNQFLNASPDVIQEARNLSFVLLLNLSYSQYKIGNYPQAIICSSQVLKSSPKHFKALYRRANCYFAMGRTQQALDDIKAAYKIDPTNRQAHDAYNKILTQYKAEQNQSKVHNKQVYKNMFSQSEKSIPSDISDKPTKKKLLANPIRALVFGGLGGGLTYIVAQSLLGDAKGNLQLSCAAGSASMLAVENPSWAWKIGTCGLVGVAGFILYKKYLE